MWVKDGVGWGMGGKKGLKKGGQECKVRKAVGLSPIYTAENFWCGLDESGTRTQKIVLITHLHVLFSTVLKDVKL